MARAMRPAGWLLVSLLSAVLFAQGEDPRETYLTRSSEAAARIDRSVALQNVRDFPEALKEIDAAVALEPDCPMAHLQRGRVLAGLERFDDAVAAYRRAFDFVPDKPVRATVLAAIGLASAFEKLHKEDEAHRWATRALLSDPGNVTGLRADAWRAVAFACRARGMRPSAFMAAVNSLADDPDALPQETAIEWGERVDLSRARVLEIPHDLPVYPAHETTVLSPVPLEDDVALRDGVTAFVGEPQSGVTAIYSEGSRRLYLLDTSGKPALRRLDLPGRAMGIAAAGGRLYVCTTDRAALHVIDPVAGRIERSIRIENERAWAVSPFLSEGVVYLSWQNTDVQRVDLASGAVTSAGIQSPVFTDPSERYLFINVGRNGCSWMTRDILLGRAPSIRLKKGRILDQASDLPGTLVKFVHSGGELMVADARMSCGRVSLSPDGQWVIFVGPVGWNPRGEGGPSPGVAVFSIHDLNYLHAFAYAPGGVTALAVNPVTGQAALLRPGAVLVFRLDDRPFDNLLDAKPPKTVVSLEGDFGRAVSWTPHGDYLLVGKAGRGILLYSNRLSEEEKGLSQTWWKRCVPDPQAAARLLPPPPAVAGELSDLARFAVQTGRDKAAEALREALASGRSVRLVDWKESGLYPLAGEFRGLLESVERDMKQEGEEGPVIYRLREALKKDPSAAWMDLRLGEALRRTGQIEEARQSYEACVQADRGRTELTRRALNDLARMLADARQDFAAIYCLSASLRADRGGRETIEALRPLLAANGFADEAGRFGVQEERPVFAPGLPPLAAPPADAPALAPERVYVKAAPSVVLVQARRISGTGFCVGAGGLILTNDHVTGGEDQVEVYPFRFQDGKPVRLGKLAGEVVAHWKEKDMALVRVRAAPADMVPLDVAAENPRAGEKVYAVGNPGLGSQTLNQSISAGLVSSAGRRIGGRDYVQHTAAVNPGNSGGPLLNEKGQVVGMVTLKASLEGVGFAIPALEIRGLFPKR